MATNPNSVETAETILENLKAEAKKAHEAEDVFLMGILTELIAVASPIVTRAVARQHREERAKINAAHKELRAKFEMGLNRAPHLCAADWSALSKADRIHKVRLLGTLRPLSCQLQRAERGIFRRPGAGHRLLLPGGGSRGRQGWPRWWCGCD